MANAVPGEDDYFEDAKDKDTDDSAEKDYDSWRPRPREETLQPQDDHSGKAAYRPEVPLKGSRTDDGELLLAHGP